MKTAGVLAMLMLAACAGTDLGTTPSNARVSQDIENSRMSDMERDMRPIMPGARLPIEGSTNLAPRF